MQSYGPLLLMFCVALAIALLLMFLATKLGPKDANPAKAEPFESGHLRKTLFKPRVSVKFYVVALLFIIFDLETVFLYPWAVCYREVGMRGLVSVILFLAILGVGLIYVWRTRALEWE